MICDMCNRIVPPASVEAGWARTDAGATICYKCCAKVDRQRMDDQGKIGLYLTGTPPVEYGCKKRSAQGALTISNWPGTLTHIVEYYSNGQRGRRDVWFKDHRGHRWHGVRYGSRTEICYCRRLKN